MVDFPVPAKKDDEIQQLAEALRQRLVNESDFAPNMLAVLQAAGLRVTPLEDSEMADAEAFIEFDPPRVTTRRSVFDGANRGNPRDRMTLAHELAHFALDHKGDRKFRIQTGNDTPPFIPPFKSAEHQAKVFASAFLMPSRLVQSSKSASELELRCGVSREAAEIKFEQYKRRTTNRELPHSLKEILSSTMTPDRALQQPARSNVARLSGIEHDKAMAWDRAPVDPERDPKTWRVPNGYLVRNSDYLNHRSDYGWRLTPQRTVVAIRDFECR